MALPTSSSKGHGAGHRSTGASGRVGIRDPRRLFRRLQRGRNGRLIRVYAEAGTVKWEVGRRSPNAKITVEEIAAMVETPPLDGSDAESNEAGV